MIQLHSSLDSVVGINTIQTAKSNEKAVQKEKSKGKARNDNPWDTMLSMSSMTSNAIEKATPRVVKDNSKKREADKEAAEEEQAAISDARNELLKPEPIDNTSL
jgi:hypothetical protein